MNKGIKALVKHELRPTCYSSVYFMFIVLGIIYFTQHLYEKQYVTYITAPSDWGLNMQSIQIPMVMYKYVLLFFGIGILIISFMMFKEGKNTETNRFLKSLPYSHCHYLIKLIMGACSYTIPFIVLVIAFIGFKINYQELFYDMQTINVIGEVLQNTDTIGYLLVLSLIYYLIITSWYLFLMMMQYLWNNVIGANVVGILIWLAPAFAFLATVAIYGLPYEWRINLLIGEDVITYLNPFLYGIQHKLTANYEAWSMQPNQYVSIILQPVLKVSVLVVLCSMFSFVIYKLNKTKQIEKVYYLIPSKVFRVIFRIGVAICSMLLCGILTKEFFRWRLQIDFVMCQILMLIAGLIGGIIAYKISCIGIEKK